MLETQRGVIARREAIAFWLIYIVLAVAAIITERKQWWTRNGVLAYVRRFVQVVSVASFLVYVVWLGTAIKLIPQAENFTSIGQWNVVAIAIMVITAAVVGQVSNAIVSQPLKLEPDVEECDESWSCEVGYAS